jgi:hypothetical protein
MAYKQNHFMAVLNISYINYEIINYISERIILR